MTSNPLFDTIQHIHAKGTMNESDLWELANHLNQDPAARRSWPGSELFQLCQQAYADDLVDTNDLQPILNFIQNNDLKSIEWALTETNGLPAIPGLNLRRLLLRQPTQNGISSDINLDPQIAPFENRCQCQDWQNHRSHFPFNSPGRLCQHLASAVSQHFRDAAPNPELMIVVQQANSLDRGILAEPNWASIVADEKRFVAAWGESEEIHFFALGPATRVVSFDFNPASQEWSFGTRGDFRTALNPFITNLADLSRAFGEESPRQAFPSQEAQS